MVKQTAGRDLLGESAPKFAYQFRGEKAHEWVGAGPRWQDACIYWPWLLRHLNEGKSKNWENAKIDKFLVKIAEKGRMKDCIIYYKGIVLYFRLGIKSSKVI